MMPAKKKPEKPGPEPANATTSHQKAPPRKEAGAFPIVGIGASAGGLEALEHFLGAVPAGSGVAWIIVQHLDPTYKGMMPELLQRATTMKVVQVTDRITVRPDMVYMIPPKKDMSLLHGVLHLLEPLAPRGLRLPIDFFFLSLAEDLKEKSIGVILSGMGSDGTTGLRAIRGVGGLALVQEPATAKFDGMPRSAIDAELADIVAPVEELPARIIGFLRLSPRYIVPEPVIEEKAKSAIEKIAILLRAQTGHDFSLYKKSTVYRRIERRMGIHQIDHISTYVRFLQENPKELDLLFKELLIGVTSFFRDPMVWDELRDNVIPALITANPEGRTLRAWVAGCSTGEEAYSLAIVFKEALGQVNPKGRCILQIYATDLDKDAVEKARAALYSEKSVADVSEERLSRFFIKEENGKFRIAKEVREMVVFAPQNLIMDPPFTRLDILSCRNLLIYLEPELQKKLLPLFHHALNPGGILILGSAETTGSSAHLFTPVAAKVRIFSRTEHNLPAEQVEFPIRFFPRPSGTAAEPRLPKPVANLQSLADQLILQRYSPAAVITTDAGDILYIHGKTGKYLEPAAGKVNWNIFAMAREGLNFELNRAFQQAVRETRLVTTKGVQVKTDLGTQDVDFTVQVIDEPPALQGNVLIVITDVAPPAPAGKKSSKHVPASMKNTRIGELEQDLGKAHEDLQSLKEEMQSSQEELKSTNEELQSTNEELQSTNEELNTSKEEMQSLNEELHTINTELQSKIEDLARVNNDMKNLLNSTDIATVFLDEALNVRLFTTKITTVIRLLPGDVGRPVTDIASELLYPELPDDAREVLQTLVSSEKVVPARDGRWFSMRIMPYRTLDNRIEGVVITFADITTLMKLNLELAGARTYAEAIIATVREPLLVLDNSMKIISSNQSFYNTFRVVKEEVSGRILYTLGNGQWDIPELRTLLETILPERTSFEHYKVTHAFPVIGHRVMMLNARRILNENMGSDLILLAFEDVT
jgi:two-component system CheB/CheR fusion protein